MKAVRFHAKGDVRVEDVPAPSQRLGDHEVLIRPLVCGICGTDLHEYLAGPIGVVEKGFKELLNPSGRNLKVLVRM